MTDAGERRRRPTLRSPTYAVRAPLARWLQDEARLAGERERKPRLLDVGCGTKPYEPFFASAVAEYVGVDVSPQADLQGTVEALPVEVAPVARGEVVEHAHVVAALEQGPDEVRADEAAAAGDEDSHGSATTW